jgi:hypothetical protein
MIDELEPTKQVPSWRLEPREWMWMEGIWIVDSFASIRAGPRAASACRNTNLPRTHGAGRPPDSGSRDRNGAERADKCTLHSAQHVIACQ